MDRVRKAQLTGLYDTEFGKFKDGKGSSMTQRFKSRWLENLSPLTPIGMSESQAYFEDQMMMGLFFTVSQRHQRDILVDLVEIGKWIQYQG